ncbi:transcription termination factor 1-like isoform X2 [Melanotaenia boesemani]|uniref:transcription termination factor 1-like isoform X2 n=1 Tax=Melanotaenia boesemani TaxID=1250792 RepID=UPI001C059B1B|nr:transcription termination factor 1-like isoform X2 [Melanotaenia boesemani]
METTEVSLSSKKKKRKSECVEEPSVSFEINTREEKKIKIEEEEEVSPLFPLANEQIILKKKKKKKQQNGEEEHVAIETSETKMQQIKNSMSETSVSIAAVSRIEETSVVAIDTNYAKKKKKAAAIETSENNHGNRLSDGSVVIAIVSDPEGASGVTRASNHTKKKKKKKKHQLEVGCVAIETSEINTENRVNDESVAIIVSNSEEHSGVTMETSHLKKKKKKKRQVGEGYVAIETSEINTENRVNDERVAIIVSNSEERSGVTMETSHPKKKKRKKHQVGEGYVATETSDINIENRVNDESVAIIVSDSEEGLGVTMETSHLKKKKKKKKHQVGEGYVAIETSDINIENMVNDESGAIKSSNSEEHSGVTMETSHLKKKKKKKLQVGEGYVAIETSEINTENRVNDESVAIIVSNSEERSEVTMETSHPKKKKRKKHQVGEGYVATETSDINIENRVNDESVAIIVSDSEEGLGVTMETSHLKKKKKKKKHQVGEGYVAIETSDINMENMVNDESVAIIVNNSDVASRVTMETNHTKKKKRKEKQLDREEEELVAIDTGVKNHKNKVKEESVAIAIATTDQNNKARHLTVSVETPITRTGQTTDRSTMTPQKKWLSVNKTEKETTERRILQSGATKGEINYVLLDELEEFIPNIRKKSVDQISKYLRYDLHRFRKFKEQGVTLRWGQCSEQENQQIRSNVEDFKALIGISSVTELMFPNRFKHKMVEIKKLKAQHRFLERIAEGIPRTCEAVYTRAKKIFDDRNNLGRFTEEELLSLKKLHCLHGNDWKTISEKTGRSIHSLQKRFATLDSESGPWKEEEVLRLKQALRSHLEPLAQQSPDGAVLTREQLCNNLPWKSVAEQVKDRSWTQCRLKWFGLLKTKLSSGGGVFKKRTKGYQAKIDLINGLYKKYRDVEDDVACIEWDEMAKLVSNATPVCVQKTFRRLKTSKVPNWKLLSNKGCLLVRNYQLPVPQGGSSSGKDGEQGADLSAGGGQVSFV